MADLAHRLAEAVHADDKHHALCIRRNDWLVWRVRLERKTARAVRLDKHVVRKRCQFFK